MHAWATEHVGKTEKLLTSLNSFNVTIIVKQQFHKESDLLQSKVTQPVACLADMLPIHTIAQEHICSLLS